MALLRIPPLADERETVRRVLPEVLYQLDAAAVLLHLAEDGQDSTGRLAVFRPADPLPVWLSAPPELGAALAELGRGQFGATELLSDLTDIPELRDGLTACAVPLATQDGRQLGQLIAVCTWESPSLAADGHLLATELGQALANARQFETLRVQAQTDALTGLLNKSGLLHRLAAEEARARRQGSRFAVLVCDLDRLKAVNDAAGHLVGDRLLHAVGQLIRAQIRASDLAARFGGDEFVLVLTDTDRQAAALVADRLRTGLAREQYPDLANTNLRVTVSIGIAVFPDDGGSALTCLELADRAMYRAKAGRQQRQQKGVGNA